MICSVGLLTPEGLDKFHYIFSDYEYMNDEKRSPQKFWYPNVEPKGTPMELYDGQTGAKRSAWEGRRKDAFRKWLKEVGLKTRSPPRLTY